MKVQCKYPLLQKTLYHDIWDDIQKRTHLSGSEMFATFPDLYKLVHKEDCYNIGIMTSRVIREINFRNKKALDKFRK